MSFADKVIGSRDDRYRRSRRSKCQDCNVADRDHRVGFEGCEIGGQSRDTFDMTLGVAPLNENVAALDDPLVMESLRHSIAGISGGVGFEHANSRQLAWGLSFARPLLRPRRKRPRSRRAAEQSDELAPS